MDYSKKYIKYKSKYLNLKGGEFKLNEMEFSNIKPDVLRAQNLYVNDKKYIAGPISYSNIKYKNKTIYLFGDIHTYTESYTCGPDDENATIYLPNYLHDILSNTNKVIDVFMESPYNYEKIGIKSKTNSGLLYNMSHITYPCFYDIKNKSECNKIYPHVRFQSIDIRDYYDKNYLDNIKTEDEAIEILENYEEDDFMVKFNDMIGKNKNDLDKILMLEHYLLSLDYWLMNYKTYLHNLLKIDTLTDINAKEFMNKIIDGGSQFDEIGFSDFFGEVPEIIREYIENHKDNLDNNKLKIIADDVSKNYMNIIMDISKQKNDFYKVVDKKVNELFKNLLEKYIIDDNKLLPYDQIKNNFFSLIQTNPKIMKNLQNNYDLIKDNYDLHLSNKNMITDNMLVKINNAIEKYYDNNNSISILKDSIQFKNYMMLFSASIMDVYTLGRMLRTYDDGSESNNIIIIGGKAHTDRYINFFKKIGGDEIFSYDNKNKCVNFEEIKF
jgi:hypothetical protein